MKTKDLVLSALFIALVFVATKFINITLPISAKGGLIHFGNIMLFTIAILFGKKHGAIAGAFGMALFDLFSGWTVWAPFTFIIRGVMGYMVGAMAHKGVEKGNPMLWNTIAMTLSGIWMIFGYYISEVVLYKNWIAPLGSILGDSIQLVIGIIVALPLVTSLKAVGIHSLRNGQKEGI